MNGICDATCKGCVYSTYVGVLVNRCCDFLLITGSRRGCPAGQGCTRRLAGKKLKTIDQLLFRGRPAVPARPGKGRPQSPAPSLEEMQERNREYKKRYWEKNRAMLNGRQRAALLAFKREQQLTNKSFAELAGVCTATVDRWMMELQPAPWDRLAKLGLPKPAGL